MKNYNDFLGIKEFEYGKIFTVISSPNRDILYAGRFYYPIIATNINNSIVISWLSKIADKLNKIIFTDGQAPMPKETVRNVIWIVFGNEKIKPKGGRVISITGEQLQKLCTFVKEDIEVDR